MDHPPPGSWWAGSIFGQRIAQHGPMSRRVAALALLAALLSACTSAPVAPSLPPALDGMAQLVEVIVQTERTVQIVHRDGGIEVARAAGWPTLQVPVIVCVAFDGPRQTTTTRVARLQDRSACDSPRPSSQ